MLSTSSASAHEPLHVSTRKAEMDFEAFLSGVKATIAESVAEPRSQRPKVKHDAKSYWSQRIWAVLDREIPDAFRRNGRRHTAWATQLVCNEILRRWDCRMESIGITIDMAVRHVAKAYGEKG